MSRVRSNGALLKGLVDFQAMVRGVLCRARLSNDQHEWVTAASLQVCVLRWVGVGWGGVS